MKVLFDMGFWVLLLINPLSHLHLSFSKLIANFTVSARDWRSLQAQRHCNSYTEYVKTVRKLCSSLILTVTQRIPKAYLAEQLHSAFDGYLAIRRCVQEKLDKALGHNPADKASTLLCPPCFYEIQNEPPLVPRLLAAMNGNSSLKLVDSSYRAGTTRKDDRTLSSPRWLEVDEVDCFQNDVKDSRNGKVRELKISLGTYLW
jgi:hypothetical protein